MKRLAIFLDGTWNTLNNNTNMWRLKSLTAANAEQRLYHSQGVGTQRGEAARGGITGYGIDDEIIEAYTWLIQNFEEGDEIFIFGFSRGAYTVRSLSGLICKCGVLKLGAPLSIEQLYARYRLYEATTIWTLIANGLPKNPSIEEQIFPPDEDQVHRRVGHRRLSRASGVEHGGQCSQVSVPRYAFAPR
jgi:hypothetical protein